MRSLLFKINLSLLLILVASFSFAQSSNYITFEKSVQKFRKVDEGHRLTFTYNFTYTGKEALIILPPKIDCSCTKVILPEGKIEDGKTYTITIKFDTSDKIGWQEREVIIQFVDESPITNRGISIKKTLTFKGAVKASKATKEAYKKNKKKK